MHGKLSKGLFYALLLPTTALFCILGIVSLLLPLKFRYWLVTRWSYYFIHSARKLCGLNYKVAGQENMPKPPFVIVCNHQSMWETLFMQLILPQQTWVLKRELLWIPFFGWGLATLAPIAIKRGSPTALKSMLKQGKKSLDNGICVLVYPEGTRLQPGQQKNYAKSAAILAQTAQVPILPIAHNAGNFWPKGPWIKQKGIISVHIGPPICPENHNNPTMLIEKARQWIEKHKQQMDPKG